MTLYILHFVILVISNHSTCNLVNYRSKHIAIREQDITELLYDTFECSVSKDFRGDQKEKAILGKSLKERIWHGF